jgi:hypothetical protein
MECSNFSQGDTMPRGSIQGTVRVDDTSQQGLTVTARDPETEARVGAATTDRDGKYLLDEVPAGAIEVKVEGIPGMDSAAWRRIRVGPGTNTVDLMIKRVTIRVVGEDVQVEPNPLKIYPGTWVIWRRDPQHLGRFTVHFAPISPMLRRRYQTEGDEEFIVGLVRYLILPGKYSYFVAVWDASRGRILTEDPEVIDENGDDRGGGGD